MREVDRRNSLQRSLYPGSPGDRFYQLTGGYDKPRRQLLELGLTPNDIKNGRPQLKKRGLLIGMPPELRKLARKEHNLNISKARGGNAWEIDFYLELGLGPVNVMDAVYLGTGERVDHEAVLARSRHLDRSRAPKRNARRWDWAPQEERDAYVTPSVQLKPAEEILRANMSMGDVWSYAMQAEMLLMGREDLTENPPDLAERFATGLLLYAQTFFNNRGLVEEISGSIKLPDEQKKRIIEQANAAACIVSEDTKTSKQNLTLSIMHFDIRNDLRQLVSQLRESPAPVNPLQIEFPDQLTNRGSKVKLKGRGEQTGIIEGEIEEDGITYIIVRVLKGLEDISSSDGRKPKQVELTYGGGLIRKIPKDTIHNRAELLTEE